MKKSLLFLLAAMTSFSFAQAPYRPNIEHKCSHQHQFANSFKNTNDVTHVADMYDMNFVHLDLEVESTSTFVSGSARMDATVSTETLDTIYMELTLTLDSMRFNGDLIDPVFTNSELFIIVDEMAFGDEFSITTYYHGAASSGGFFSGVTTDYNSSYGKYVTWTLSEPFAARDWWPVRQNLNDKIDSVYQDYTCVESEMVGTNGLLTEVVENGDGTKTYKWKTYYPISYYLMSFSVSEYQEYNVYAKPIQLEGDSVLIQNFIYDHPNCLNQHKSNIDLSPAIMETLSEAYGVYPFHEEKYGNCLTQLGGGMEHQTMTTIGGFGFQLNTHEMAHQWYGDNITCATWSDIWINEGFASYSEYVAIQNLQSQSAANSWMNSTHNYVKSSPGGSVFVPEDEIYYGNEWRIFDGRLTYDKGAAIIHQIRYLVNDDDLFFAAMQNYTIEFTDSIATGIDFRNSISDFTGVDLDSYFEQWYFGEGYPTYSVEYDYNDVGLFLTITQSTSTMVTPFFDLPLDINLNLGAGNDTTFRVDITDNITQVQTTINDPFILLSVDPDNWIINKVGSITVGTYELNNDLGLVVGPNPVNEKLQIVFDADNNRLKEISILDLSGREVYHIESHQSLNVDMSSLNSGAYLVKVKDGQSIVTRKIIKQ